MRDINRRESNEPDNQYVVQKTNQQSAKSSKKSVNSRKREIAFVNSEVGDYKSQGTDQPRVQTLFNIRKDQLDVKCYEVTQSKFEQQSMDTINTKAYYDLMGKGTFNLLNDKAMYDENDESFSFKQIVKYQSYEDTSIIVLEKKDKYQLQQKFSIKDLFQMFPVFSPAHSLKLIWDLIVNGLSVVPLIFIPISFIYRKPLQSYLIYGLSVIIPIFLILDLLVSCNTSFYKKGKNVLHRLKIVKHFVRNNFISDIAPMIVYLSISSLENYNQIVRSIIFLFFTKVIKIRRIFKKFEESMPFGGQFSILIQLAQLFLMILFITHLLACLWLYIGVNTDFSKTWININGLESTGWRSQYLHACYYSIVLVLTVGNGYITPTNNQEIQFTIIMMLLCYGVFAYSLSKIGYIFISNQKQDFDLRQNLSIINGYMEKKKVSPNLQYDVRQYLEFFWREEKKNNIVSEQNIINQLSVDLKEALQIEANKRFLIDSPIFKYNFSKALNLRLVSLINEMHYQPNQNIFIQGDFLESGIYFIEKGRVEIYSYTAHPMTKQQAFINRLQKLSKGECFGEFGFFSGQSRKFSVKALEFSTIQMIKRSEFIQLLQEYPDDYEKFCMIKDKIMLNQQFHSIGVTCYACNKDTHFIGECPKLHFVPKKTLIIMNSQNGSQQDRQKQQRKNQKTSFLPQILSQASQDLIQNLEDNIDKYVRDYLNETDDEETHNIDNEDDDDQEDDNLEKYFQDNRSNYDYLTKFQSNISNLNHNEAIDSQTVSQRFIHLKNNEQIIELLKQQKQVFTTEPSVLSMHNTTIQQLLPKMPSQNSITEKIFKENILPEEPNFNLPQNESINSIQTDHNNLNKRPSLFKILYNKNNNDNNSNQNEKDYEDNSKLHHSQNRLSPHDYPILDVGNGNYSTNDNNNIFSFNNSTCQLMERKSSKRITQTTRGSQKLIHHQYGSTLPTSQTKQLNRASSTSSNNIAYHGKHSIQLIEQALSSLQQRSSLKKKTQSNDQDNHVFSFFNKQLKDLKGFYEDLTIEIVTDTMRDYKIYYPSYNSSSIITKLNIQREQRLNKGKICILRSRDTKTQNGKYTKSKSKMRLSQENLQEVQITNYSCNCNTEMQKKDNQVFTIHQDSQIEEDQSNCAATKFTENASNTLPYQSFIIESQEQEERQINNIIISSQKRDKYCKNDDSLSICLPEEYENS